MLYIIYADIESLIIKRRCANSRQNSSTIKIGEHIPFTYSVSTIWAFHDLESKHILYHEKIVWKIFVVLN